VFARTHLKRSAPFGRGRFAARVLAVVIDAAAAVGGRLPTRVARGLAEVGGNLEWALRPALRRRLADNLAHAVGPTARAREVRALVRREILNEARRSADLLWAINRPDEFLATVRVDGVAHVADAAARGRGVLLAGIHVGGWEVAAPVPAAALTVPTTVLVADDWLAWAIEHVRVRIGLNVVYRSEFGLAALRVLRRGEALLILGDDGHAPRPRVHRVDFCDSTARLPAGIVALSRLSGAPIVPFDVLPLAARRWHVSIGPPIEPPDRSSGDDGERCALQQLADHWTEIIRRHPEQWAARFAIAWDETS
jgi:lauroyl/myristoyl acyltransferase